MIADLTPYRDMSPEQRERACFVQGAAFAEAGYSKPSYPGAIPLDCPPRDAHKASCLARIAVGQQPPSYEEWIQMGTVNNLDRPEASQRWVRYLALHGITAQPSRGDL